MCLWCIVAIITGFYAAKMMIMLFQENCVVVISTDIVVVIVITITVTVAIVNMQILCDRRFY